VERVVLNALEKTAAFAAQKLAPPAIPLASSSEKPDPPLTKMELAFASVCQSERGD
jgi:hypothetical protein